MKKKINRLTTFILILIFLAGLSLLLYPTVSDYWNSYTQSKTIASYVQNLNNIDTEKYDSIIKSAQQYNASLKNRRNSYLLSEQQQKEYTELLDITGDGVMGYVDIPSVDITLPIYHGTSEKVLQTTVGHLEWTSLPVGGEDTHCVISGHRGLPSAKLFTDLDKLSEGDVFMLRVLDEVLTYQVDQIRIVEPTDTNDLKLVSGEDLCTLFTCTPYGVNSHRLLVRGHRIENIEQSQSARVVSDAIRIDPIIVAPVVAIPMLLVLLVVLLLPKKSNGADIVKEIKEGKEDASDDK